MSTLVYEGLEPAEIWRHFAALNNIPRPSKHEGQAVQYVLKIAATYGCTAKIDSFGNCVVYVQSRNEYQGPPIAVQAHLDMVGATAPDVVHDFTRDPIVPRRVDEWIYATGSTLGADNGIGAATCLALITTPSIKIGSLELLFTVQEEIGLLGASGLDSALISAKKLINLDSEDPSTLTIGSAGGQTLQLSVPLSQQQPNATRKQFLVSVSGLKGGHSGVEINEGRGNAIKLAMDLISSLRSSGVHFGITAVKGGVAHNAIPTETSVRIAIPEHSEQLLSDQIYQRSLALRSQWASREPALSINLKECSGFMPIIAHDDLIIDLINAIPIGVQSISTDYPGVVQTSVNLGTISSADDLLMLKVSTRSFIPEDIIALETRLIRAAVAAGGTCDSLSGYPAWLPNRGSNLFAIFRGVCLQVNGVEPIIEIVHAGLECAVIAKKIPGIDAISFGPRIEGAHTHFERVNIGSVGRMWAILIQGLTQLSSNAHT